MTQFEGWLVIAGFALLMFGVSWVLRSNEDEPFLVANRNVGMLPAAMSIAATWIWAPALFISTNIAFTKGIPGLFWFAVPNFLSLVIFSLFAKKLVDAFPGGFTMPQFMEHSYSPRVKGAYLAQMLFLNVGAFAVQLLAGGMIFSVLTGIPFLQVTVAMTAIVAVYSALAGLRASIRTDWIQMGYILLVVFTLVPWAIFNMGGVDNIQAGLGGITGEFTSLFDAAGIETFLLFGLATSIVLLTGPIGDQMYWQRAFSIRKESLSKAYLLAACIFITVPASLGLLGFAAAGANVAVENSQLVNYYAITSALPAWAALAFVVMLMCGLVSTLDSALCSASSMAKIDLGFDFRWAIVAVAITGLVIANIPGMKILYLWLFMGTTRAATFLPTVLTLCKVRLTEDGVFYGIILSIVLGLPFFAYGNWTSQPFYIVTGSLAAVLTSGVFAYARSLKSGSPA